MCDSRLKQELITNTEFIRHQILYFYSKVEKQINLFTYSPVF